MKDLYFPKQSSYGCFKATNAAAVLQDSDQFNCYGDASQQSYSYCLECYFSTSMSDHFVTSYLILTYSSSAAVKALVEQEPMPGGSSLSWCSFLSLLVATMKLNFYFVDEEWCTEESCYSYSTPTYVVYYSFNYQVIITSSLGCDYITKWANIQEYFEID